MHRLIPGALQRTPLLLGGVAFLAVLVSACGGAASQTSQLPGVTGAGASVAPSASAQPSAGAAGSASSTPSGSPADSGAPEASGAPAGGDIPDNAVFLTYHQPAPRFSIQYVEGWQVTTQADGVLIRDKDSSETVAVVSTTVDPASYASGTDVPALKGQAGFKLIKQDTTKVGAKTYVHIAYHIPSPPDPVTGKQVPLTVDRYYVPGSGAIAIVSLAAPEGIDNVDGFRRMIESFTWS